MAPADGDEPERTPGVRERQRLRTDDRIVDAVMQLMRKSGPAAVTMEAVSALSGVAKTTLYRRYRDRFDLMEGVASKLAPHVTYPSSGLTAETLTEVLGRLQETFELHVGYAFVGHLLTSDEDFMVSWREKVIGPRIDALRDFFARGVTDGVLRADADYQLITEFVMGGAVMADALRGGVPDDWAASVVRVIWPVIAAAE